jgi:hypothetical protein
MVESFHRAALISPLLNVPAGLIAAAMTPLGLLLIPLPYWAAVPVAILIRPWCGSFYGYSAWTVPSLCRDARTVSTGMALVNLCGCRSGILLSLSGKNLRGC